MAVTTRRATGTRRFVSALLAMSSVFVSACASDKGVAPVIPGQTPNAQFRPLAFTADINTSTGRITITAPTANTANAPTLSTGGAESPNLSLLGGEAVRLIPSNYQASAVGAFAPGKIRVTFDVLIENKLPGIRFITPTWPIPPAGAGVVLFPLDYVVTTTPGGVTGGDGNEVILEQPRFGAVDPSPDWSGTGAAGSGAPFSFFNDADCSLITSNDCFRWESFDASIDPLSTSSVRTVGFDIDATVGQFRARMIVAADLAPAGVVAPGTVSGLVTSAVRGPLAGVVVTSSTGATATTDAAGAYSLAGVNPGSRTVTLSNLPAGCTAPGPRTVAVTSGANTVADFTVTCTGLPGTISGTITSDNVGELLPGVTVTASTGGTAVTTATGAYTITGAGPGAGTLTFAGLPAGCIAPAAPYTLASGGTITADVVIDCPVPVLPGYQYNTTWVNAPGGQVYVDIRFDMRTFDDPAITNVTTSGVTGDPITVAQLSITWDQSRLTYDPVSTADNAITSPRLSAAPIIGAGTPGQLNIVNGATGAGVTGNVGFARIYFNRAAGGTTGTTVTTSTTFTVVSSAQAGVTVDILPRVRNVESTFVLPAPLP